MSSETAAFVWFWGTTAVLAVALYFPVHRLIWVVRVRRAERQAGKTLSEAEREELRRGTRLIAAVITIGFAFLFNRTLVVP